MPRYPNQNNNQYKPYDQSWSGHNSRKPNHAANFRRRNNNDNNFSYSEQLESRMETSLLPISEKKVSPTTTEIGTQTELLCLNPFAFQMAPEFTTEEIWVYQLLIQSIPLTLSEEAKIRILAKNDALFQFYTRHYCVIWPEALLNALAPSAPTAKQQSSSTQTAHYGTTTQSTQTQLLDANESINYDVFNS